MRDKSGHILKLVAIVAISMVLLLFGYISYDADELRIWFFDVGQGDSTLIDYQDRQVLIDGGPGNMVLQELGNALTPGDRVIDAIVVTHLHADHITGIIEVVNTYEVGQVFINYTQHATGVVDELKKVVSEKEVPVYPIRMGDEIRIDDLVMTVLWPQEEMQEGQENENENAVVIDLELKKGGFRGILPSDFEMGELSNGSLVVKSGSVDLLKVPHQGSSGGVSAEVLDRLKPEIGIISVGENNQYGHPSGEIIKLLEEKNVTVLRTDVDGTVLITVGEDGRTNYQSGF